MEPELPNDYIGLVLRLHADDDGTWYISMDGTQGKRALALRPATVVLRLKYTRAQRTLRGTIQLEGSPISAPIATNAQIVELVRSWLLEEE